MSNWKNKDAADTALLRLRNEAERVHPFDKHVGVILGAGQVRPSPARICKVVLDISGFGQPEVRVGYRVRLERTGSYRSVPAEQVVELT